MYTRTKNSRESALPTRLDLPIPPSTSLHCHLPSSWASFIPAGGRWRARCRLRIRAPAASAPWSARFNCSQLLGAASFTRMKKLLGWLVTGLAQITFDYLKIV